MNMHTYFKYIRIFLLIFLLTSCALKNADSSVEIYTMYGEVGEITETSVTINLGNLEKEDLSLFKDKKGSVSIHYSGENFQIDKESLNQYIDTSLSVGDILQLIYIMDDEGTYMVSMSKISYESMNKDITKSPMDKSTDGQ